MLIYELYQWHTPNPIRLKPVLLFCPTAAREAHLDMRFHGDRDKVSMHSWRGGEEVWRVCQNANKWTGKDCEQSKHKYHSNEHTRLRARRVQQ